MYPFRIEMVNDYSISEQYHSVSQRVLVVEVGSHLVFLTQQRHCSVDDDTSARPERICQDHDDIVKTGRYFRLLNSFLCKYLIDRVASCRSHAIECVSETVVYCFVE